MSFTTVILLLLIGCAHRHRQRDGRDPGGGVLRDPRTDVRL